MLSVAPDHDKIVEVEVVPEKVKVGALGGVVSAAKVVIVTALLGTDRFPSALIQ
jgi:hypothetical protein